MIPNRISISLLLTLLTVVTASAAEPLRLAGIFADHLVLQREQPVQIWGWADKGQKVQVEFAGQAVETSAANDGTWTVTLKSLEATQEGKPLSVESGDQSIVVDDVLVGEVWHASGQSNMAMTVGAMQKELNEVKADIAAADLPVLRFCRINEPEGCRDLP